MVGIYVIVFKAVRENNRAWPSVVGDEYTSRLPFNGCSEDTQSPCCFRPDFTMNSRPAGLLSGKYRPLNNLPNVFIMLQEKRSELTNVGLQGRDF